MSKKRAIRIQGARTHNLKNIHCDIPHGKLTVITGPSGSGKSSLAFDTLYAEGQRRFVESMSTYARQFLERIQKPDVEQIQYLLPTIALEQKNHIKNARSTVGTATEIYDFLRLLYAAIGTTFCPDCGTEVTLATPQRIETELKAFSPGTKLILTAPVSLDEVSIKALLAKGYFRAWQNGDMLDLNTDADKVLDSGGGELEIIIDRVVLKGENTSSRLIESVRKAMELSPDRVLAHLKDNDRDITIAYQTRFACRTCDRRFEEPFPNMFSFNSPLGACPTCEGFGRIIGVDLDKVIPNRGLSLEEGAVHPYNSPSNQEMYDDLLAEAKKRRIPIDVPYENLTEDQKAFVLNGGGRYEGVHAFFRWLESKKYKVHVRVMLAKYRGYYPCPECDASGLRKEALNVRLNGDNIHQLCKRPVSDLVTFFAALPMTPEQAHISMRLRREIGNRLNYLQEIGLGYLTLARQSRTLSGGEAQRISLSSALGSALTDTLYVLDEPTVGLHARDTERLLTVLKALRDYGNTLLVVEHDPEMIMGADHILDVGPTGGHQGGHVVFEGGLKDFLKADYSQTAYFLQHPPAIKTGEADFSDDPEDWIEILGARGNNLKNLDVRLPKNRFVCVSGISGSGKSTLIKQTLYAGYQQGKGNELTMDPAQYTALNGLETFKDVILVDQSPPGRSIRSNPVTYVKAYDEIRKLFAASRQAQALGVTASHFSFNTPGGRCETCEGLGVITIDMQFMADVTVQCTDCQGKRFSPAVLAIELDGKTITQVLDLTVNEAMAFFKGHKRVLQKLKPLADIGLGYLHLGQSTATLSGGEAQRLKLASYLSGEDAPAKAPYLFLFDEPTTGLHVTDIHVLLNVFRRLLQAGHSVIVIEHNIELLAHADYLLDLGPEGGEAGGYIVAQGTPEEVTHFPESHTGRYLKQRLTAKSLV